LLRAILFDVDGTLAETERDGHRIAFNQAFGVLEVPWRWDEEHYGALLEVTGGREALAARLHALKNDKDSAIERSSRLFCLIAQRVCCVQGLLQRGGPTASFAGLRKSSYYASRSARDRTIARKLVFVPIFVSSRDQGKA